MQSGVHAAAASSSGEPYAPDGEMIRNCNLQSEIDAELEERESVLRQEVPALLDSMNRASSEINELERQAEETQTRYRQLLAAASRLYEDLRTQYGSAIDKARPYYEAAQALSEASQRVQGAVREFSAAASRHGQAKQELRTIEERLAYGAHKVTLDREQQSGLSIATVRVLRCQQERDRSEQEYARALREYQDAQEQSELQRAKAGDAIIRRALPCFRQLQNHQQELDRVRRLLGDVTERTKASKSMYHSSLHGLDRINVAVHDARRESLLDSRRSVGPFTIEESDIAALVGPALVLPHASEAAASDAAVPGHFPSHGTEADSGTVPSLVTEVLPPCAPTEAGSARADSSLAEDGTSSSAGNGAIGGGYTADCSGATTMDAGIISAISASPLDSGSGAQEVHQSG